MMDIAAHEWKIVDKDDGGGWDFVRNNPALQKLIVTGSKEKTIALAKLYARHGENMKKYLTVEYVGINDKLHKKSSR